MENKNNTWIWVVVVVVVVGILFFALKSKKDVNTEVAPVADEAATSEPTESAQDVDQVTGVGAASISYADALIKYKDRRIQLNKMCQAYPNNVTYKDNTGIMIDNRSPLTRTVKVGVTFTIKPWGFKIVILPDIYLKSKTLLVDCDKLQNVATVLVQE